jgi:hypothetical protein
MKRPHFLILGAWLLHAAAWFLPVVKGGDTLPTGLPGWQAFRVASSAVWPYEGVEFDKWYGAVLATISAVTTLLFLSGSPCVVLTGSRPVWRVSAWVAATAFIVNAHWYVLFGPDRADLRIGYYFWWFSFVALAIGLFDLAGPRRADESAKS